MTRYEAIEKALVQKWRSLGNSNTYTEFHSGQASSWLRCADELEAALALPEDSNDSLEQPSPLRIVPTMTSNNTSGHQQLANSKTVNAELYGLAVELADEYVREEVELTCAVAKCMGDNSEFDTKAHAKELRYLELREASGEPMPYKVVRDGDKVRFL